MQSRSPCFPVSLQIGHGAILLKLWSYQLNVVESDDVVVAGEHEMLAEMAFIPRERFVLRPVT